MDVSEYYDQMHTYTWRDSAFELHSGIHHHAIHRFLQAPDGSFSPDTIHTLLAAHLPRLPGFRGLDAGCGYGGTCFRLLPLTGGVWTGITISATQRRLAAARAVELGFEARAHFARRSYDDPQEGSFHAILAIESLAHSRDPAASLTNLARHLRPGGVFLLVDDMPRPGLPAEEAGWLAEFRRYWHCPVLPMADGWRAMLAAEGLELAHDQDLLPLTRPRPMEMLETAWVEHSARLPARRSEGFGAVAEGELGGIRLEQLMRRGAVEYRLMVARRPG
ncbi:SAM-dependent methyltransferase [Pseudoroseomonas globiformis]|uniref:SAM-dependent methyltransferase n=1 Tax=Teichococcus globiformis TaxID=2307229 RepID=A0ABV7G5Y7_9PROT